jgi:ribosomal-protein-alanine N-acetyltransferase
MMFDESANASSTPLERHLRYMQMGDINDVVKIDQASFDPAWTSASYEFEINRSPCSYMIVLEERQPIHEPNMWQIVSARLRQSEPMQRMIVGYGGLWKIQEESHISTVASHPDKRGFGYGEILLAGMIRRALFLGAEYMVLEVRVSNHVAQKTLC